MFAEERNAAIEDYKNNFPAYMEDVFTFSADSSDTVGMLGASFYVLQLGGAKIAVDPYIKLDLLPELSYDAIINSFIQLDGVLLTHEHRDHYDRKLISILRCLPLKWYVPHFFEREKLAATSLPNNKIVFVEAESSFYIKNIKITPFDTLHADPERNTNTREYGYSIKSQEKKLLFPADVRIYNPDLLPKFGPIDTLFLHIWLGSGNALNHPCEPRLSKMCNFAASFKPEKIFLGHLYEFDRTPEDMWTSTHAALATNSIEKILPKTEVVTLCIGKIFNL